MEQAEGFEEPHRVLAFLDAADREKHRGAGRQAQARTQRGIGRIRRRRKRVGIDAVADRCGHAPNSRASHRRHSAADDEQDDRRP